MKSQLYRGQEVALSDDRGTQEVVIIDLTRERAYVERENGDCEWVARTALHDLSTSNQ